MPEKNHKIKCEFEHCDDDAEYVSDTDSYMCFDCMEQEIDEWRKDYGDYDHISTLPYLKQNQVQNG